MDIEKILELNIRREIYRFILMYPGLHIRELSRKLNVPKSTMIYHLNYLEKHKILTSKTDGGFTRFYVSQTVENIDKKMLQILRQNLPLKIILFLLRWPNSTNKDISKYLNKHRTTVAFHLKKLQEMNIVECDISSNETRYIIKNHEDIYRLLITYKKRLFDENISIILDWLEEWHKDKDNIDAMFERLEEILPHPYYA
jgi:predicted transcriptional regulator